ncbi:GNAT family N-acetyltransferase [Azotosporobacter soli]|uniref:GNAT family N-acetyltransferase n=1 Tax=Azotosporobacter soli TaxID=3055040 RepID=UPI0031FF240D
MKDKYRMLCEKNPSIPIFSQSWWLDAVCGMEGWEVLLVEKGGEVVASWPYNVRKKYGMQWVYMPTLTQTLGIWLKYPDGQKYAKRLPYEKELIDELINRFPSVDFFWQQFHYSITNWLPFYWRGYKQTTKYTYVIDDLSDLEAVFANFEHAKRKNIKRAESLVSVKFDLGADAFYENHKMTLAKQGETISYSREVFERMYQACYQNNAGKTIYAVDADNHLHAALFIIWDSNSAYNLISTIDSEYRNSGAASLLVREAIRFVSDKTAKFDFEGSMIEGVENSFRQFGAVQRPYFAISKNSRRFRVCQSLRELAISMLKG